ncbi:hypothetical protein ACHAXA_005472 [Cyclostephanos tholiformis]|uniref:Uncharacterized protein n=1 Tax=Cyclostephanos tholiformis TaxID=382380 RepID=A0ABD3SHF8_9STRA
MTNRRLFLFFVANSCALALSLSQKNAQCLIKICHHKDCVKRGGGETLLNTFRDLLPRGSDVTIERSGCQSQCGKGPNVSAVGYDGKEKTYFSVEDPTTASAILDAVTGQEYSINLLVAATFIVEAELAPSAAKKESILSSVISLSKGDPTLLNSFAHAHALFLRADARLDMNPPNIEGAIEDAKLATGLAPDESKGWRVLAYAQEAIGNIEGAIDAFREWARVDVSFSTKSKKEIERLSCLL